MKKKTKKNIVQPWWR